MLACVCLNPSFDRTVSLRSFTAGDVNRVLSARRDVGGKGINVAITARRLGIASCVLGCAGKNGIDAVRRKLDGEQVTHVFLPVDGDVRTNMKSLVLLLGQRRCRRHFNALFLDIHNG